MRYLILVLLAFTLQGKAQSKFYKFTVINIDTAHVYIYDDSIMRPITPLGCYDSLIIVKKDTMNRDTDFWAFNRWLIKEHLKFNKAIYRKP